MARNSEIADLGQTLGTAKYYLRLTSPGYGTFTSGEMLNNSGTTNPYFTAGTGDTTNIVAVNNHDYKIVKSGIYLITFTANFYGSSSESARFLYARIRTNLSSPTSSEGTDNLAEGATQVSNTDGSNTDYGGSSCQCVHNFSANSLINFQLTGSGTLKFNGGVASIVLIRPV
tara:strand:+ start:34 stop:549 length:516 start_codon:yes stop_codon:yes gene_type:complete